MTPIYATERAIVSQWWAYKIPDAPLAVWDGGATTGQVGTGFWCPIKGHAMDASDRLIANMPRCILYGHLDGERFHVTGFPNVEDMVNLLPRPTIFPADLLYPEHNFIRPSFLDEYEFALDWLPACCSYPKIEVLPEHELDALHRLQDLGPDYVARHPESLWTPKRSCMIVSTMRPETCTTAIIRDIIYNYDLDLIDYVEAWSTVECLEKIIPLYPYDDDITSPFWKKRNTINIYKHGDQVIGYQ